MKTVITGGNGFIGSHLVKRLLEAGREVTVVSDFARLGTVNMDNLGVKVTCYQVDLRDYAQTRQALAGAGSIFHLAARVGSLEYLHGTEMSELVALQTNLVIDANIFRACRELGVKNLVYASSCAVYPLGRQLSAGAVFTEGDFRPELPGKAETNPDGGYGWSKLMGEIQLHWTKGIDIGIARIFNIYGVNEPLGEQAHVVADLINKTRRYPQEPFVVWGDGRQSRDFLYVEDCAEALFRLESKAGNPPLTVNVGSDRAVTIGELAEKIVAASGKDIPINYDTSRPVGPFARTADTSRARRLLDWMPAVGLDEGLRRTYKWIDARE
jgi:nucleoside-diphosphate-sugar epimerase